VIGGLVAALAGLGIGARLLVQGAVGIAQALGISERVIGLTVVAIGTSLPELVASIAAALRKQHEMAVTNIVGSNIFNLLLILGTTGVLHPIPVAPRLVVPDMLVMLGVSLLLLPPILRSARLSRRSGLILLAVYATYLITVGRGG
jgi:cation:H+ antiporter